jgi:CBS-domain-containing membrane protein
MGLTIALGQVMGCLHPPAGAVALLGVLFSRLHGAAEPYPHHWL